MTKQKYFIKTDKVRGCLFLSQTPSPTPCATGGSCLNFLPRRTPKQRLPVSRDRERDFYQQEQYETKILAHVTN